MLVVKNPSASAGDIRDSCSIPGPEDPLEEGTATHSSILAWRVPWTEPGGLQPMGSQRVKQDWSSLAHTQVQERHMAHKAESIYHQALHTPKYSLTTTVEEIREASKNGCISSFGCRAIQGAWNRDQETWIQAPAPWLWAMHQSVPFSEPQCIHYNFYTWTRLDFYQFWVTHQLKQLRV